jgi:hypothetical protein
MRAGQGYSAKGVEQVGVDSRSARRRILAFAVLGAACLALGIRPQILEVGKSGLFFWVREGDLVCLHYTQSMYGVPVEERFRVEGGRLVLLEVLSTDAALEYLGIETRGAGNANRALREFSIPADSVGDHVLTVGDHRIPLKSALADQHRILVRLVRQPLLIYFINKLREPGR